MARKLSAECHEFLQTRSLAQKEVAGAGAVGLFGHASLPLPAHESTGTRHSSVRAQAVNFRSGEISIRGIWKGASWMTRLTC